MCMFVWADIDACATSPCDLSRSTCTDMPAAAYTGVNKGKPAYVCACLPDYSGIPASDGKGCGECLCVGWVGGVCIVVVVVVAKRCMTDRH